MTIYANKTYRILSGTCIWRLIFSEYVVSTGSSARFGSAIFSRFEGLRNKLWALFFFFFFLSLSVQEKGKFTTKEKNSRSKSALFIFPFFNIDPTNQEASSVENIFPFYKYCQILEKYEIMGDYYAEAGKCIEKVLAKKV